MKWIDTGAVIDAANLTEEEEEQLAEFGGGEGMAKKQADFQTWSNSSGREIKARFLSLKGDSVQLLLENGKQYSVPLDSLSEASAEQARLLAEE